MVPNSTDPEKAGVLYGLNEKAYAYVEKETFKQVIPDFSEA